ncbi:MAG: hypothetical protein Unbinned1520contig1002_11 [Prokaryotic dsDNA virus sp.]|nr:MAG: hypothetical protein Unbinned1520contig1002_11 [Prokaryotic dsDNA virus sp.]|tara:strand:+ start:25831 stop:26958 length:1128 start_codon:yes stop_codon:yes gene_type:complete
MSLVTANQFQLVPDITGAINQFQNARQIQQRDQQLEQQQQSMSDNQKFAQSNINTERENQKQTDMFKRAANAAVKAQNLPNDASRVNFLNRRIEEVSNSGGNPEDSQEVLDLFQSGQPDKANALLKSMVDTSIQVGLIKPLDGGSSAEGKSFESLIANFSEADKTKSRRIKARLDPGAMGSAIQTIAASGITPTIAAVEKVITEAKEVGKLTAQFKLKPVVDAAVISAVGQARAEVAKLGEERSSSKTLNVYNNAMSNLTKSLDDTVTGPFIALTPALTANAQIADGATAMMLPLMKDVFRGAGEGTFTEGDQKILTDLIPTRNDLPEARAAKISMIDSMIRAKLTAAPVATSSNSGLTEAEKIELQQLRAEMGQ